MINNPNNNDITEAEWITLSESHPPVIVRPSGEKLVICGRWVLRPGEREFAGNKYQYVSLSVIGHAPGNSPHAHKITAAYGSDVEEYVGNADAGMDFTVKNYTDGKFDGSRLSVYLIDSNIPIRVKVGVISAHTGAVREISHHMYYYEVDSAAAYRAAAATAYHAEIDT